MSAVVEEIAHVVGAGAGHAVGASARTAARDLAVPAVESAAKAAAPAASRAAELQMEQAVKVATIATKSSDIKAYGYAGGSLIIAGGTVAGGIVGVNAMNARAADLVDKTNNLLRDGTKAAAHEAEAAIAAITHGVGGLGRGLSQGLSGPAKTAVEAASAAVVVGGVIFTVYGVYRLFR